MDPEGCCCEMCEEEASDEAVAGRGSKMAWNGVKAGARATKHAALAVGNAGLGAGQITYGAALAAQEAWDARKKRLAAQKEQARERPAVAVNATGFRAVMGSLMEAPGRP